MATGQQNDANETHERSRALERRQLSRDDASNAARRRQSRSCRRLAAIHDSSQAGYQQSRSQILDARALLTCLLFRATRQSTRRPRANKRPKLKSQRQPSSSPPSLTRRHPQATVAVNCRGRCGSGAARAVAESPRFRRPPPPLVVAARLVIVGVSRSCCSCHNCTYIRKHD